MVLSLSFCRSSEGIVLDSSGENLEERISTMNKIIGPISSVPSKILDTHYIETKIGNGRIGPSDYYFYASIKASKGEVKKWSQPISKIHIDNLAAITALDGYSIFLEHDSEGRDDGMDCDWSGYWVLS